VGISLISPMEIRQKAASERRDPSRRPISP
jgi:hypothetical protein